MASEAEWVAESAVEWVAESAVESEAVWVAEWVVESAVESEAMWVAESAVEWVTVWVDLSDDGWDSWLGQTSGPESDLRWDVPSA